MKSLISQVLSLKKTDIGKRINKKIKQFDSFKVKSNDKWFSELCFCLLTANSKAKTAASAKREVRRQPLGHVVGVENRDLARLLEDRLAHQRDVDPGDRQDHRTAPGRRR